MRLGIAQIGQYRSRRRMKHDPEYVQYLLDKWLWRSWRCLDSLTGHSRDYLTALEINARIIQKNSWKRDHNQFLRHADDSA